MDYKQALKLKVEWEKNALPRIRDAMTQLMEEAQERQANLHATTLKLKLYEAQQGETCEYNEKTYPREEFLRVYQCLVKSKHYRVLYVHDNISFFSSVCTGDIEKAIEYLEKLKDLSHKMIECFEITTSIVDCEVIDWDTGKVSEIQEKEYAYKTMCDDMMRDLNLYEKIVGRLSTITGVVEEVLEANRKRNMRKNKGKHKKKKN